MYLEFEQFKMGVIEGRIRAYQNRGRLCYLVKFINNEFILTNRSYKYPIPSLNFQHRWPEDNIIRQTKFFYGDLGEIYARSISVKI